MIAFHPVAVRKIQINAAITVLSDRAVGNRVAVALAVRSIEIDAVIAVFADGAVGNRVAVALAVTSIEIDAVTAVSADGAVGNRVAAALATISIERDAATAVSADGAVGNRVAVALAVRSIEIDAVTAVSADGAVGNRVAVALAGRSIEIDAVIAVSADGAVGNRVAVALAVRSIEIDAVRSIVKECKLLEAPAQAVFSPDAIPKIIHSSVADNHMLDNTVGYTVHKHAIVAGSSVPAEGKAHQVQRDTIRCDHHAVTGAGQIGRQIIGARLRNGVRRTRNRRTRITFNLPHSIAHRANRRIQLIERLHRRRRSAGRGEGSLPEGEGGGEGRESDQYTFFHVTSPSSFVGSVKNSELLTC